MERLTISLRAPVSPTLMQHWVQEQVDRLRVEALRLGVLLGRPARSGPSQRGDWLVAVVARTRDVSPEDDVALSCVLLDLELLGLRPALVVAAGRHGAPVHARRPSHARSDARARHRSRARRPTR